MGFNGEPGIVALPWEFSETLAHQHQQQQRVSIYVRTGADRKPRVANFGIENLLLISKDVVVPGTTTCSPSTSRLRRQRFARLKSEEQKQKPQKKKPRRR